MPKLTSLFILLLLAACTKVDLQKVDNLNGGKIAIVGHGGSGFPYHGFDLPANTFESVVKAVEGFNVDGIEVDVQISRDSVLFLFHDEELAPLTDCGGCLINMDSTTLLLCRYRQNISSHVFKEYNVAALERAIQYLSARNHPPTLNLNLKFSNDCPGTPNRLALIEMMGRELNALIKRYDATAKVYVEIHSVDMLEILSDLNPAIQILWSGKPDAKNFEIAKEYDIYGFSLNNDDLSIDDAERIHAKGFRLSIYNVRTREAAIEAVSKSPDFIETDNILLLQQILSK